MSKAEKLRAKRNARSAGRPRKEGMERFPSGKIKPAETEKETLSVGIEARKRIHGETCANNNQNAGYTLGRMLIDGRITQYQKEAGDYYAEVMMRYYKTVGVPFPSARAQSLFTIKGYDGDVTEDMATRARRASNAMMEMERILLSCQNGPQVKTTVFNTVIMDYEVLRMMPEAQLVMLKRGLDKIHCHRACKS